MKALGGTKRALDPSQVLTSGAVSKRQRVATEASLPKKAPVSLEITDDNDVPLARNPDYEGGRLYVVVGVHMRLRVHTSDRRDRLGEVGWTVTGHTVGRCVQGLHEGSSEPLADDDLEDSDISFFWIAGGVQTVTVTATLGDAGEPLTASVMVEVLAPTVNHCRYVTSTVNVLSNGQFLDDEGEWLGLYEPKPRERFGCSWDASVTGPSKLFGMRRIGAGYLGFIQVSGFYDAGFELGPDGVIASPKAIYSAELNERATAVDTWLTNHVLYRPSLPVTAGGTVTMDGGSYTDSPGSRLDEAQVMVSRKDLHQMYLVYKSMVQGSIWVTLRRAEWKWEADVSRTDISDLNSAWGQPENVVVVPPSHQLTDADVSHVLPTWTERAADIADRGAAPLPDTS
jgi:hypothetical protein